MTFISSSMRPACRDRIKLTTPVCAVSSSAASWHLADSGGRVFAGQVTIVTFAGGPDNISSSKLQGNVLDLVPGNGTEAKSTEELEHRCVFREDLRD